MCVNGELRKSETKVREKEKHFSPPQHSSHAINCCRRNLLIQAAAGEIDHIRILSIGLELPCNGG